MLAHADTTEVPMRLLSLFARQLQVLRPKAIREQLAERRLFHAPFSVSRLRFFARGQLLRVITRHEQDRHVECTEFANHLSAETTRRDSRVYIPAKNDHVNANV